MIMLRKTCTWTESPLKSKCN